MKLFWAKITKVTEKGIVVSNKSVKAPGYMEAVLELSSDGGSENVKSVEVTEINPKKSNAIKKLINSL